jgi:hypothetical protein
MGSGRVDYGGEFVKEPFRKHGIQLRIVQAAEERSV